MKYKWTLRGMSRFYEGTCAKHVCGTHTFHIHLTVCLEQSDSLGPLSERLSAAFLKISRGSSWDGVRGTVMPRGGFNFSLSISSALFVNEAMWRREPTAEFVFHAVSQSLSVFSFSLPFKNTLPREKRGGFFPLWKI